MNSVSHLLTHSSVCGQEDQDGLLDIGQTESLPNYIITE